uniref:Uncharacterized protein n=1 Tax=Octactis speculum TaxID=3111310 RepID=A0A7S2D952_9STRA
MPSLVWATALMSTGSRRCYGVPHETGEYRRRASTKLCGNSYDDFCSSGLSDNIHLAEEHVIACLDEFVMSDYGQTMFGCHPMPQSVGITGEITFEGLDGPVVELGLKGLFWHKRATVLGKAAIYLNARMPEIIEVNVGNLEDLEDESRVLNEMGDCVYTESKRAPDFNGDRATMEYQGIDPDVRGPFPPGTGGLRPGGSMLHPA